MKISELATLLKFGRIPAYLTDGWNEAHPECKTEKISDYALRLEYERRRELRITSRLMGWSAASVIILAIIFILVPAIIRLWGITLIFPMVVAFAALVVETGNTIDYRDNNRDPKEFWNRLEELALQINMTCGEMLNTNKESLEGRCSLFLSIRAAAKKGMEDNLRRAEALDAQSTDAQQLREEVEICRRVFKEKHELFYSFRLVPAGWGAFFSPPPAQQETIAPQAVLDESSSCSHKAA